MRLNPPRPPAERLDTSPTVSDEVKTTTCYMCACRCGIKVHLKDGKVRYIEGNRDHPVNRGVLCAKGSAGIMTQNSPAKLRKPLKRVGERGRGEFVEIEWDEALGIATQWLSAIRWQDPRKLAFFTGRDQSQALTGWWAKQFGTPNYAAHGGFCSVNMAAAGLYSIGGSFWEFGEPDWDHTRYFVMFGVAEDHASNPIKIGLGKLKGRLEGAGAKFLSINPVRTGYSAIADEWLAIKPGTDGLLVLALAHELLRTDKVDYAYLARYTNAGWLVIRDPGAADHGLFVRDEAGRPFIWDRHRQRQVPAFDVGAEPMLAGEYRLADGRAAVPSFQLVAERLLDRRHAPEAVSAETGIAADTIRRIAGELAHAAFEQEIRLDIPWTDWLGRRHDHVVGRPVSMHAMRGVSAHSNGFHTCRAIHILQMLLGSIDCPGGFRYKPPYPKPAPPSPLPAGLAVEVKPGEPLGGIPLGFPHGPEHLLVDPDGSARRIDKAYSWEAPLAAHGLLHMVIANAWKGDPYPIDTLFLYMTNMAWNSAMNSGGTAEMLADKDPKTGRYRIPHVIYSDAYFSEMVAYADLVLPDTTYLERHDCISLLDRPISDGDSVADAIRQPVLQPDRDVRPFQDVLIDLGARLGLPGLVDADGAAAYPGGFAEYMVKHERRPGIGMLAGWRGADGRLEGRGAPNPGQLDLYKANGCFWRQELAPDQRYFRFANRDYLAWATAMGFLDRPEPIHLRLYVEVLQKFRLAAEGHGAVKPPQRHRQRIATYFDPLPFWYRPLEEMGIQARDYPFHAITQRPMAMYHSWGSQNAWLRQIHGDNPIFVARETAARLDIADGDWVWIVSPHGRVKAPVKTMDGVNPDTVWTWNAIGRRGGSFGLAPDAPEAKRGFIVNSLVAELLPPQPGGHRYSNSDPVTGQAAWFDLKVRLEKCAPEETRETAPQEPALAGLPGTAPRPSVLRYGAEFRRKRERP
ncbi:MAG: molybdopterin oxidoreductase family protein [Dongiaceae bacterium]